MKEIAVFVKIVELGSFKAAADELHLTQSAMTQRLKKLEDHLGVRLLDRTTRSVAPTVVGRSFLPVAKRMLMQFDQSMEDLRNLVQARTGQVTISSLISVATYVLPSALKRFRDDHPNVSVRIVDDAEQEIAAHVLRGEAEFGIDMETPSPDPEISAQPLMEDRYVLVYSADYPSGLTGDGPVSWERLVELPLVMLGSRSGTNRLLHSLSSTAPRTGNWRFEVQHLSTLMGAVRGGLGVGIVPALAMRAQTDGELVQRALVEPDLRRKVVLVQRRGIELSPAAEKLKAAIVGAFARMADAQA